MEGCDHSQAATRNQKRCAVLPGASVVSAACWHLEGLLASTAMAELFSIVFFFHKLKTLIYLIVPQNSRSTWLH